MVQMDKPEKQARQEKMVTEEKTEEQVKAEQPERTAATAEQEAMARKVL